MSLLVIAEHSDLGLLVLDELPGARLRHVRRVDRALTTLGGCTVPPHRAIDWDALDAERVTQHDRDRSTRTTARARAGTRPRAAHARQLQAR